MDNYADPFKAGLTNYCGGHVTQYHYHAFPECFFNQKTLAGTTTFLPAKTPGVVLGYAFDGFPIPAPTVALRPQRALQALNLQGIEDGERMQRAMVSLATEATASIDTR